MNRNISPFLFYYSFIKTEIVHISFSEPSRIEPKPPLSQASRSAHPTKVQLPTPERPSCAAALPPITSVKTKKKKLWTTIIWAWINEIQYKDIIEDEIATYLEDVKSSQKFIYQIKIVNKFIYMREWMSSLLPFLTPNAIFTPSGVFLHLSQPTHTHTY